MNREKILNQLSRLKTLFNHSSGAVRFSLLFLCLTIIFFLCRDFLEWSSSNKISLRRYVELNHQLTEQINTFEEDIRLGKLVKREITLGGEKNSYSMENVLKQLNQIIYNIDSFEIQHIHIKTWENADIAGIDLKINGSFFSLLSFVNEVVTAKLPVEINHIGFDTKVYPDAVINMYLKIKGR